MPNDVAPLGSGGAPAGVIVAHPPDRNRRGAGAVFTPRSAKDDVSEEAFERDILDHPSDDCRQGSPWPIRTAVYQ